MLNRRLWHAGLDEYLFHSGREGCLIRPHAGNDATGCQETEGNSRHDIMDGTVFELQYHLQQGSVEATDLMGVRNIVAYAVWFLLVVPLHGQDLDGQSPYWNMTEATGYASNGT